MRNEIRMLCKVLEAEKLWDEIALPTVWVKIIEKTGDHDMVLCRERILTLPCNITYLYAPMKNTHGSNKNSKFVMLFMHYALKW